jgi:hypothetical protein|tara:strand:- start:75 stop:428 length:354 start_codon:yes stop_codon:yes gene_type:complete
MKIFEFTQNDSELKLNFDSIEDLVIYMRNDPMFYRKEFFPCMASISDKLDKGKTCDPAKDIGPCVDKACDTYCNRYDLHSPKTLFPVEDRRDIVNKVYQEEIANLKAGMYKAESSCS